MNRNLSPDERSELVLKEMTLDEKIALIDGNGMPGWGEPRPNAYLGNGGAGLVLGVPRPGIPMIQMSDAAHSVRASAQNGRYGAALPSNIALAASWDAQSACEYGALIGRELRARLQHDSCWRRQSDARTAQWPLIRIHGGGSHPCRNARLKSHEF